MGYHDVTGVFPNTSFIVIVPGKEVSRVSGHRRRKIYVVAEEPSARVMGWNAFKILNDRDIQRPKLNAGSTQIFGERKWALFPNRRLTYFQ